MRLIFEQIKTGGDRNFGYLIADRDAATAVIIDPSYQPEVLVKRAEAQQVRVELIINTHGHGDHTNGNDIAKELTGAEVATYCDSVVKHDVNLTDGMEITVGELTLRFIYTPGHCEDHMVVFVKPFNIAITGDHLFVGKVGGTSSEATATEQYDSFQKLYQELPMETTVWPGHDVGCRPSSTLAIEKECNPFLRVKDLSEFLNMKKIWSNYKADQGLI